MDANFYYHVRTRADLFEESKDIMICPGHPVEHKIRKIIDAATVFDCVPYAEISDNGVHGDGITFEIHAQTKTKEHCLVCLRLSNAGAKTLAQILDNILKLRAIDEQEDVEDE